MKPERVTFRATLPPVLAAIKVSGDGGARIQLDIPDTDLAEVLRLIVWRDCVLKVTVEPVRE